MSSQQNLMVYAIVALVVGSALGYGGGYMTIQPKLDAANTQVTSLTGQVNDLNADVAAKATEITALQNDVASKTTQIDTLTGQLNTATETVAQKTAELEAASTTISQQADDLDAKDGEIQTLSDEKAALGTQVTELTAKTVPKPGYTRIQFFGLTFEAPDTYKLKLTSVTGYASQGAGYVQASDGVKSFTIAWEEYAQSPDFDALIDASMASIAAYNPAVGEKVTTTINGHTARYATFSFINGGVTFYGIDAYWYCAETQTAYEYTAITTSDSAIVDMTTNTGYATCH